MCEALGFTRNHLWIRVDGRRAQIGVSDHGQSEVGEVIAVELPDVGDEMEKDDPFGELECTQMVFELGAPLSTTGSAANTSDEMQEGESFGELECTPTVIELVAPVSGTVRAVNTEVETEPTTINEDPYRRGWLVEVKLRNTEEIDLLMGIHEYEAFVAGESDEE